VNTDSKLGVVGIITLKPIAEKMRGIASLHGIYDDFLVVNDMYFPADAVFPG
jgi:hypothetical protein